MRSSAPSLMNPARLFLSARCRRLLFPRLELFVNGFARVYHTVVWSPGCGIRQKIPNAVTISRDLGAAGLRRWSILWGSLCVRSRNGIRRGLRIGRRVCGIRCRLGEVVGVVEWRSARELGFAKDES